MRNLSWLLGASLLFGAGAAVGDDGLGLRRGANIGDLSISGVSSGAALATQFAVAHSASVNAVGSIAGPAWGCAQGKISQAINNCMCGRQNVDIPNDANQKIALALELAADGTIDALLSGKPRNLKKSYVFHSPADQTVVEQGGKANAAFLTAFVGQPSVLGFGNAVDGSNLAGHGIISPDATNESCQFDGSETTYIRHCKAEDNAGRLFHAIYAPGIPFDASKRVNSIPDSEVWQFDQKALVNQVRTQVSRVAPDSAFWFWTYSSARRKQLDMADKGYIYVPQACRQAGSSCRVHIALHGCKQDARVFSRKAGFNNWADHYRVIVVYPAIEPGTPVSEAACRLPPVAGAVDDAWIEPNPNGCWDWWGYLDPFDKKGRYLTKQAPQMLVLERIIAELALTHAD